MGITLGEVAEVRHESGFGRMSRWERMAAKGLEPRLQNIVIRYAIRYTIGYTIRANRYSVC